MHVQTSTMRLIQIKVSLSLDSIESEIEFKVHDIDECVQLQSTYIVHVISCMHDSK